MSEQWEQTARGVVQDLHAVFGARLQAVVGYGEGLEPGSPAPLTLLALVASLTHDDLDACAHLVGGWRRKGVDTPLVLPVDEFRRSLDAFPIEYADIIATHHPLFGPDPFATTSVDREDVRRACERQVASHLLHLREGYMQAAADPQAIAQLIVASAPAFAALLRSVARLTASTAPTRQAEALAGARALGVPEAVVSQVMALEGAALTAADGARLFPAYLAAVELLVERVDRWRT